MPVMETKKILTALGQNIYNHFLETINPGEPFVLMMDPFKYHELKEKTGNIEDVDRALQFTGSLEYVPTDYIAIAVANLQVQLIYDIAKEKIDDSFYDEMKKYYPNYFYENNDILRYFEQLQENIWGNIRNIFLKRERFLQIPKQKSGSGRYVQFPKSQRLITWNQLSKYADKFGRLNLKPYQMLSYNDFFDMVSINYDYSLNNEENEIIRKIVFSFYCNWDGSTTEELRKPRQRKITRALFLYNRAGLSDNKKIITLRIENEDILSKVSIKYYLDKEEIPEQDVKRTLKDKNIISFLYDEENEDWIYTTRPLHSKDSIVVLVDNKLPWNDKYLKPDFKFERPYYKVYGFNKCNTDIANFAKLSFISKEYFTIIGGINILNCYHFRDDVLGAWYDFALPKIKINQEGNSRVFIDSKEIVVNNNIIDLVHLTLKESNQKWFIGPKEKEYSLRCTNLPPVYFMIKNSLNDREIQIENGWNISRNTYSLRPIKLGETPFITGLLPNYSLNIQDKNDLRPFLMNIDKLQNRPYHIGLNKKISSLEKRKLYGI